MALVASLDGSFCSFRRDGNSWLYTGPRHKNNSNLDIIYRPLRLRDFQLGANSRSSPEWDRNFSTLIQFYKIRKTPF